MNLSSEYVEVHIFRKKESKIEFLVLKRSETESYPGIWQPVTGSIKEGEKAYETALREIKEETNLMPERFWVAPRISSFYLPVKDAISLAPVFAAEINFEAEVKISEEHSDYKWVSYEEANKLFAWMGQRESLKTVNEYFSESSYLNFNELKLPAEL